MSSYPEKITKYEDDKTFFKASHMNIPIRELEGRTDFLREEINNLHQENQVLYIETPIVHSSVLDSRVVYFDGSNWKMVDSLVLLWDSLNKFPLGVYSGGKVYLSGIIQNVNNSIVVSEESLEIGTPYFLSNSSTGRLTNSQPTASIFVGIFLNGSDFLLNFQYLTTSHLHRKTVLDPFVWEDHGTYFLYPIEELGQLPLPFEGSIICFDERFWPKYGAYEVDVEGIKLTDIAYIEALVGSVDLWATITNSNYVVQFFWSDPRTLSTPGVMTLTAETDNLTVENTIQSQPNSVGSLKIKNIPTFEVATSTLAGFEVIKRITSNQSTGELQLYSGKVVERIKAGSNITVSQEQGAVTVSAISGEIREENFNDVFLLGASSVIYPGSIITYTKFENNGAVYSIKLPYNLNESKVGEVYILYSGDESVIKVQSVILPTGSPLSISPSYKEKTFSSSTTLYKDHLISFNNLKKDCMLYIKVTHSGDGVFNILNMSIKYYVT